MKILQKKQLGLFKKLRFIQKNRVYSKNQGLFKKIGTINIFNYHYLLDLLIKNNNFNKECNFTG